VIIEKLRLVNVKSYSDSTIDFAPGINLICGDNGAGKSTIIEAIGYALFGVLPPMNKEEFIRTGQRSCTVQVWFLNGGHRYMVERTMRATGNERWIVFENDAQLDLHNRADVMPFLRDAMGIGKGVQSEKLFSQMIAIGQNEFLAPFLLPPARRTAEFNSILGVESYRKAGDALLPSQRVLEDGENKILLKMAPLAYSYEHLAELEGEYQNRVQGEREAKAAWSAAVTYAETMEQLQAAMHQRAILEEQQTALFNRLAELTKGEGDLERLQNAYEEYTALECTIGTLGEELKLRSAKVKELQKTAKLYEEAMARIQTETERFTWQQQAHQEDAQTWQEAQLQHRAAYEEALCELTAHKEDGQTAQAVYSAAENRLEQAQLLLRSASRVMDHFSRMEKARLVISTKEALLQKQRELNEQEAERTGYREAIRKLEADCLQLKERMEYLKTGMEEMACGRCPIAGVACPLGEENAGEVCTERIGQLKETIAEKQAEMGRLQHLLTDDFAQECNAHRLAMVQLAQNEVIYREEAEALEALLQGQRQYVTNAETEKLEWYLDHLKDREMESYLTWAEGVVNHYRKDAEQAEAAYRDAHSRITALEQEMQREEKELMKLKQEGEKLKQQQRQLTLLEERIAAFTAKAQSLGYERDALPQAQREYEEGLSLQQTSLIKMQQLRPSYDAFLQLSHQQKEKEQAAAQLEHCKKELAELAQQCEQLQLQTEAMGQLAQDAKEARRLVEERAQAMGKAESGRMAAKAAYETARGEAALYEEYGVKLKKKQAAIERMKDIREVLKQAGGPMAAAIRQKVSALAADTYRTVSGEGGSLVWEENFDIRLSDQFDGSLRSRRFHQLSGGEKMTAALAVRLALIETFSNLSLAFFDEPTSNLDAGRRVRLGEMIPRAVKGFDQLFFISHDDTFYSITENVIFLEKTPQGTHVRG